MNEYEIKWGDNGEVLKTLPDNFVDCCVTSPSYYNLRDYHAGENEIGHEDTPEEYVLKLRDVFHEVKRVLKPTGTLWLNLGDSYDKNKNLMGIPWRVAFALKDDGWTLRSDIVWCLAGNTYVWARTQKGDMPCMLKDIARLRPETVKLWNGKKWTQLLGIGKSTHTDKIGLVLRSGEQICCTEAHQFPVFRNGKQMLLQAKNIRIGDKLIKCKIPESENAYRPIYMTDDVAWLIGVYLADGSKSGNMIQLALNTETKNFYQRIKNVAETLGCHAYKWVDGKKLLVNINGKVINAIIDEYVHGNTAHKKHFSVATWMLTNQCLTMIMKGYLDCDGHYDEKNDRYRLGFCRNPQLERDLRIMAARLGGRLVLNRTIAKYTYNGEIKAIPSFRGEWRWNSSTHWNCKKTSEVIGYVTPKGENFYDLTVEDEPHLFSLASGILTHNCKPNPMPNSVTDRCASSHEYIFLFSKQPSGYYFDYEAIEEPASYTEVLESRKRAFHENETLLDDEIFKPDTDASSLTFPKFGGNKYPNADSGADSTYSGKQWKPKQKNMLREENGQSNHSFHKRRAEGLPDESYVVRRKRDVWTIAIKGYTGAHFATFPEKLVEPCILAGCPKGGIVLDCFNGAATTGVVALKNNRRYLGIELNPEYIKISEERIAKATAQKTFNF